MPLLRTSILGAAILAIAWLLFASRPGSEAGHAVDIDAGHEAPAVHPQVGTPLPIGGNATVSIPPVTASLPVEPAAVNPAEPPPPERPIRANSPYPAGGKPVAPVDLAWDIAMATDGSRAFHGSISITTRSGPALIAATLTGVGGATVTSAGSFSFPAVAAGQRLDLPVAGVAAAGPAGGVTIAVTYTTSDTRGRAVRIDLRDPAHLPAQPQPSADPEATAQDPAQPIRGTRIVTDDSGGRTILQPSSPPPHR